MRKIRTKRESMDGALTMLLFFIVWFSSIIQDVLSSETPGTSILLLAVAGIIPGALAFWEMQRAFYYRKLHRQAMNQTPEKGRIVSYERQARKRTNSRGVVYDEYEYRLIIEIYDNISYTPRQIRSEPYSWPVYEVLASPEVDVYTDDSGWHYTIDGFQYKKHRKDEGIFKQSAWEKGTERDFSRIITILIDIILFGILLSIWFRIIKGSGI